MSANTTKSMLSMALACSMGVAVAAEPDNQYRPDDSAYLDVGEHPLDQRTLITEVVARNAQVLFSELQIAIAEDEIDRERGAYQPFWFAEGRYTDQKTENTAADRLSSSQRLEQRVFREKRVDLETGVQVPVRPTGADVTLSWSAVRRDNNLIPLLPDDLRSGEDVEYTAGLNLVIRQPLLRGLGNRGVQWQIEQAELERMVSEEQFRQRLLQVSSEALSDYWQLFRMERFLKIRRAALENAQNIRQETNELVRAGRQPQLALLEAEASIIDRQSELEVAEQAWLDAQTELKTLLNLSEASVESLRFVPVDEPESNGYRTPVDFDAYFEDLLGQWPGYLIATRNREIERLRLRGAREERRPQLDLVLGYSTSVLSYNASDTYSDAFDTDFPTWFAGLEIRMPLGRNVAGRADERSARSRVIQADSDVHFVQVSLANELRSRLRQLEQAQSDVELKRRNRSLYQQLFDSESQRFNLGQVRLRDLYEREDDRIRAEQRLVDAMVREQLAIVALKLAEGSLFDAYGITISSEVAGGF